jgi:hypothetical protein
MSDSKHSRPETGPSPGTGQQPPVRPGRPPSPGGPAGTLAGAKGSAAQTGGGAASGKVVHDQRGNAVWDWLKETGRNAIESTSRLLRKLEAPGLKMEDEKDEELRLTDDSADGGYDPYNQRNTPRRPGRK